MPEKTSSLAVIGGGRWGRILCRVAAEILDESWNLYWVTKHSSRQNTPDRYSAVSSIDELPASPTASIVANAPSDHADTAEKLLKNGSHVLVEKPFVLKRGDAEKLISLASDKNLVLAVAHVVRFASYFEPLFKALSPGVADWKFVWEDPQSEVRHGENKSAALYVSPIFDVFPHIWSALQESGISGPSRVEKVCKTASGDEVTIDLATHLGDREIPVTAVINREGKVRRRIIEAQLTDGGMVRFDFSTEPGALSANGRTRLLSWDETSPPLKIELSGFFDAVNSGKLNQRLDPELALDCYGIMELADKMLKEDSIRHVARLVGGSETEKAAASKLLGRTLVQEAGAERQRLDLLDISETDLGEIALKMSSTPYAGSPEIPTVLSAFLRQSRVMQQTRDILCQ